MVMTEEEIEHYEKYKAAYHEMGHTHIIRRYGGVADPLIWKNAPENVENNETTWLGTTKIWAWPGQVQIGSGIAIHQPPQNWEVLVGLAGLVAEYMYRGEDSAFEIAGYIEENIWCDELSESDRKMIEDNWGESDVQTVIDIFTAEWDIINDRVEILIRCSR